MDVGAGSVPLDNLSFEISDRNGPSPEPAVLAVSPAYAVFGLIVVTRLDAVHPLGHAALCVLGMHEVQPTEALTRTHSGTGIFVKPIANIVPRTIGLSAEDDVGRGTHNGVEFLVLSCQFNIELLQCLRSSF